MLVNRIVHVMDCPTSPVWACGVLAICKVGATTVRFALVVVLSGPGFGVHVGL